MKRFLSLVLTLVMVMSLVTVSAGAKDFTDDESITYDEAVAVVSEVGIVDGYADGKFNPTNTLTRQAAAKIICNLILGPTTAAELHADTAPYRDVPVTSEFAGYIAYCQAKGIISGYADGAFRPGNTLTGYAFMKMLLGALGYDATLENYVGANWSINVAKQALGIGLNAGLVDEFNGIKAVTREEACLYAFNTLQADLVEYGQRLTTNVNGTEVTLSSGGAESRKWNSQQSRYDNIRNDNIVQFAEEYFNKLVKRDATDKFMRPANTWLYDKIEIGTWTDWTLLVERYTEAISGKDVYDLLGSTAIRDNTLLDYVDGANNTIEKTDLVRTNKDDLAATGNGVLTEIFLDTDTDELTISCINTYLAQADDDYVEAKERAPLTVWGNFDGNERNGGETRVYNVDVEDVPNVVDVRDEQFYLVNISYKDADVTGEVVILSDVEIMEDSTVTKFSASNNGRDLADRENRVTKLTTGGTEYKNNVQAYYDEDILDKYNDQLLTDNTYNVFMDPYGYFIGVSLFEGTKNYVFITGFDRPRSNISVKTADAAAIFLDGTMDTIKVNVTDTDTNIRNMPTEEHSHYFLEWKDTAGWLARANGNANYDGGVYNANQWYTYTKSGDVYTLKPCTRMTATRYARPASGEVVLKTDRLDVVNNVAGSTTRVYGEEESTYITVEQDIVDTTTGARAITDVKGVYTGAQSVNMEVDTLTALAVSEGQVYTVYDKNYFIIGAVVIGEADGANANYAFLMSRAKSEEKIDDTYYWEFDAVLNGEIVTLTAKSKYPNTITVINNQFDNGVRLAELRFDGDYVVNIKTDVDRYIRNIPTPLTSLTDARIDGEDFYDIDSSYAIFDTLSINDEDGVAHSNVLDLKLQGFTLYVTNNQTDVGLALTKDCKAVVIQDENGKGTETPFTSVKSAIARLAEPDGFNNVDGTQYEGRIVAALNSDGAATWIVFVNDNELITGNGNQQAGGTDQRRGVRATDVGFNNRTGNVSFNLEVFDRPAHIPATATATVDWTVRINGVFAATGTDTVSADGTKARLSAGSLLALAGQAETGDRIDVTIDNVSYNRVKVLYVTSSDPTAKSNTVNLQTTPAPATPHTTELAVGGAGVTLTYEIADSYDLTAAIAAANVNASNITTDNGVATDRSAIAITTGIGTITTARATNDSDYARVIITAGALSQRGWNVQGFAAAAGTALGTATWATGSSTVAGDAALQLSVTHDVGGSPVATPATAANGTPVTFTVTLSGNPTAAGAYNVEIAKLGLRGVINAPQAAPAVGASLSVSKVVNVDKDLVITAADVKITPAVTPVTIAATGATWADNKVTVQLTGTAVAIGSFYTSIDNAGVTGSAALVDGGTAIEITYTGGLLAVGDKLTVDMTEILAAYDVASADTYDTIELAANGACTLSHT